MAATSRKAATHGTVAQEAHRALLDAVLDGQARAIAAVQRAGDSILEAAALRGRLVTVSCKNGSPLQALADVAILAETGEEAVSGSTRLAAASAQKAALGAMSTLAAAMLGHIYRGRMVNMRVTNSKLN